MKKFGLGILAVFVIALLAGCAAGPNPSAHLADASGTIAGFWLGLWHGFISPVTFVISLFNHNVQFYDVYNNGGWYNFGFILGAMAIFGGGSHGGRYSWQSGRRRRDR